MVKVCNQPCYLVEHRSSSVRNLQGLELSEGGIKMSEGGEDMHQKEEELNEQDEKKRLYLVKRG